MIMTKSRFISTLFIIWLVSLIVILYSFLVLPNSGENQPFRSDSLTEAVVSIGGLWLPPLTCFIGLWFPSLENHGGVSNASPKFNKTAAFAGAALTLLYVICIIYMSINTVTDTYDFQTMDLPEGESFEERIQNISRLGLLFNPLGMAPVLWATRV